jgi:histidyl-tRNA synthetase
MKNNKLSTESYKGVRDFYPEDKAIQNYIFKIMSETVESFGYNQYDASVLEPYGLYKAKSGEEIVSKQSYNFIDKGGREVMLRPEMTPTVARMVAQKRKELIFPLRWYSIPNLFRYERPQKGRLREHWQLNVDIFGPDLPEADAEIVYVAYSIIKNLGLRDKNFEIRINDRKVMYDFFDFLELNKEKKHRVSKLIDRKDKIKRSEFKKEAKQILKKKTDLLVKAINSQTFEEFVKNCPKGTIKLEHQERFTEVIDSLKKLGIKNVRFAPSVIRGLDYYTSTVFEVFDIGGENNRAILGGGRYDDLVTIFGQEKISAIGFGMGDVTIKDILKTYGLLPKYQPKTDIYLALLNPNLFLEANKIARKIRKNGKNVEIDLSGKKIGEQIKLALKKNIPYIIFLGEDEVRNKKFKLKNLKTTKETVVKYSEIENKIQKLTTG